MQTMWASKARELKVASRERMSAAEMGNEATTMRSSVGVKLRRRGTSPRVEERPDKRDRRCALRDVFDYTATLRSWSSKASFGARVSISSLYWLLVPCSLT